MALTEVNTSVLFRVDRNIGTTTTGRTQWKHISIGTLNPNSYDMSKCVAIGTALEACIINVGQLSGVKSFVVENQD